MGDAAREDPGDTLEDPLALSQLDHYVISARRNSRLRTLRLLGACHRNPGIDFQDWIAVGDVRPSAPAHTSVCEQRWPGPSNQIDDPVGDSSDSSSGERV